jgi:hypothetical protein
MARGIVPALFDAEQRLVKNIPLMVLILILTYSHITNINIPSG